MTQDVDGGYGAQPGPEQGQQPGDRPWWGEPWGGPGAGGAGGGPLDAPARPVTPTPTQPQPPVGYGAGYGYGAPPQPPGGAPVSGAGGGPHVRNSLVVLVAVVALLAAGIGAAVGVTVGRHTKSSTASVASISPAVSAAGSGSPQTTLEAVAAAVSPAVVLVTETFGDEVGTGSGVVIDATNGYILTNNHVVSGFATTSGATLTVTTMAGKTVKATVVGRDPTADIAVIKVSLPGLTQAQLGDSSTVKVGETVLAFGAPLGLQGTVTSGIVSALNRPVSTEDTSDQSSSAAPTQATIDAIQTDAAINPGNSGGALVDSSGKVIGINSAIASVSSDSSGSSSESGNIGVGFAIPINEASYTADQLIKTGHAVHAIIGVALQDDSTDPTATGAVISSVTPGGPGAKAGLQPGDVITAIDGQAIPDADAAIVAVRANHRPGDKVSLSYTRGGTPHTVSITLGASAPS